MKGKKIIIALIIINILTIGIAYNFIKKDYLNSEKIIVKAMTEIEYEDSITALNKSHENYTNSIEESKKKIASAITDMGVETSNQETLETMANNIRKISTKGTVDDIKATYFMIDKPTTTVSYEQITTSVNSSGNKSDSFNKTYQIPIILNDNCILYKITMNTHVETGAAWAESYTANASVNTSLTYCDKDGVVQSITGNDTNCSITNNINNSSKTSDANPTYTINGISGLYYTDTVNLNLTGNSSVSYSGEVSGTATATVSNIICTYIVI